MSIILKYTILILTLQKNLLLGKRKNTMAKGKIQWQKEKYNGKRENTMAKGKIQKDKQ
jgi:hypothetical protein